MKKMASILLTVVTLTTMLSVFSLSASAKDVLTVDGKTEISDGSYFGINLRDNADLVIGGDVKLSNNGMLIFAVNSKLTVKSGCSLTGENISFNIAYKDTIEIEDGGKMELSFEDDNSAGYCVFVLESSQIPYKRDGNRITAPYVVDESTMYCQIKSVSTEKVFDVEGGNETSNYKNGTYICSWTANNQDNQIFKIHKMDENGKVSISPKYEGNGTLYVNAYGGAKTGAYLRLWNDGGSIDSQWYLQEQDEGNYIIQSANGEYYIKESNGKFILASAEEATLFELQKVGDYTGSILSEGNFWIIAAVAVVILAGVAVLFIFKKKKKPALANGVDNKNEE